MIKVKLINHEYRYEVFQIISLFFNKTEFQFLDSTNQEEEDDDDKVILVQSGYNIQNTSVFCRITGEGEKPIFFEQITDKLNIKSYKNSIKRVILEAMKQLTGIEIPWGILVGIRPTKIVHEAVKEGKELNAIKNKLMDEYMLTQEKANLTIEVAGHESNFLKTDEKSISVYLGIPFCPTRCSYCSFTSNPIKGKELLAKEYVDALIYETNRMMEFIKNSGLIVDTLYFGGGTPTALSAESLSAIIETLGRYLDLKALREFTIEAGRADSIDIEKLKIIKESGCNRISINPQSMNDDTLHRIGRLHSAKDVIEKFNMAREMGFHNINMDLIIGLPGETVVDVSKTVEIIEKLSPENITVHTMAIKRASVLNEQQYSDASITATAMGKFVEKAVRNMDMYPYYMYRQKNMVSPLENIGYCKENHECIYNIQMIAENLSIVALGADAVTKIVFPKENRIERAANVKDVREYINRIDEMISNKIKLFDN